MSIDTGLLTAIGEVLPDPVPAMPETVACAPCGKGSYARIITTGTSVEFAHKGIMHVLSAGTYIYAGSAYGPGGIGARLRRHFQREKKLHWHVDRLTSVAESIQALAIEQGSECEIVARLGNLPGVRHPVAGFGSSDCRICCSHLLQYCSYPGCRRCVNPCLAHIGTGSVGAQRHHSESGRLRQPSPVGYRQV